MSTQIVMTQAMNSKELSEVRSRQSTGSSNLQADPEVILYPPNPNSDALDLYIFDGFLNTMLLIGIPLFARSSKDSIRCKSDFSW